MLNWQFVTAAASTPGLNAQDIATLLLRYRLVIGAIEPAPEATVIKLPGIA